MSRDRVTKLYAESHQMLKQAQELLAKEGTLSEPELENIRRWTAQAEEIETRARNLEKVMDRDMELLARENESAAAATRSVVESKGVEAAKQFKSCEEFMLAIYNLRMGQKRDPRLEVLEYKALGGEVGISGGFLLPESQRNDILTTRSEISFMRSRAKFVPMGARVVPYPALDYSQGAAGVSAFFGGVQVYYTSEGSTITASQSKFKEIELHARELQGYCAIPNSTIRDSPISLTSFLKGQFSFGGALAWKEDYDSLRGTGAGKLLGVLNAPGKLQVTRNAGSDFKFVDAVTMKSRMLMSGAPIWVINQSVMPKLYSFVDAGNNNLFLPSVRGLGDKPVDMLLGYPIYWTEKTPALGTTGDVCLIDFGYYLLGDRQVVTMDIDTSFLFGSNQTAFRVTEAIDGQPWLGNTITLADGSTTVSPYVVLN